MPPGSDVLGNEAIRRQKPLSMPRGFEPLHAILPMARRPVRVLTPVIEVAILAVFHAGQHLALGCTVALQLIGDKARGTYCKPLSNLRKNFFAAFLSRRRWTKMLRTLGLFAQRPKKVYFTGYTSFNHLIHIRL